MRQTLKNIEIIVVNDCSPDNSEAIILEYAARDSRIVYIKHEENKCLGGARNTGMRAARGEYIAFVDSDDYVDARLYEAAINAFDAHEIDLVIFPAKMFVKQGKTLDIFHEYHDGVYTLSIGKELLDLAFCFPAAWNKVYRTADLRKHDILFPEHTFWEDNEFLLKYCAAICPRVIDLPRRGPGYRYRRHAQSATGSLSHTVKSSPLAYLRVYQVLEKTGHLDSLYLQLYQYASEGMGGAWNVIDPAFAEEFKQNCLKFLHRVHCPAERKLQTPEWYLIGLLRDEDQMLALDVYLQKYAALDRMRNSHWYQFGQLSPLAKIKKLIFTLFKRIWRFILTH